VTNGASEFLLAQIPSAQPNTQHTIVLQILEPRPGGREPREPRPGDNLTFLGIGIIPCAYTGPRA